MHVLLILLGLLGGFAAPASLAAITPLQWASVGLTVAGEVPKAVKANREMMAIIASPAFRAMLAANGEAAIRWQDRQMEN